MQYEEQEFELFYSKHPEFIACEANTNALYAYLNGDEVSLENLEDCIPYVNLAKAGKKKSFDEFCREFGLSKCESNKTLYGSTDNPELFAPMTTAEREKARTAAVAEYNRALLSADPIELQQHVRQESEQRRIEFQKQETLKQIKVREEMDAGRFPAIPETNQDGVVLDGAYFRKLSDSNLPLFKLFVRKHGFAAVTARLNGVR